MIQNIIQQLEEVQHGRPWVGSSFDSKLKQADEKAYFKRPLKDLHSIAEIISHLTFWRMEAILKINTGKGIKTDACEENWVTNEDLKHKGWDRIKSDYDRSQTELIALIKTKNDDFLSEQYYDPDFKGYFSYNWLLNGMIQHDVYHLGQIGIIVKLLNKR